MDNQDPKTVEPESHGASTANRPLWRWQGWALVITGLIHTVFGLVAFRSALADLAGDGLLNAVGESYERHTAVWFLITGFVMILLGMLVHHLNRTLGRPAPRWLGWGLVVLAVIGLVLIPASGFWLVLALGFWYALSAQSNPTHH